MSEENGSEPETIVVAPKTKIPWDRIVKLVEAGLPPADAARRFDVKYDTVKKYLARKGIKAKTTTDLKVAVAATLDALVNDWAEKGEIHRALAFQKAHESLKMFRPKAPRNFRELEAADKVARRAAGLETADIVQQTLINVNEAIEKFDEPVDLVAPVETAVEVTDVVLGVADAPLKVGDVAAETPADTV
jgi:hypothetical protein